MKRAIEQWDGKEVAVIQSVYDQFSKKSDFAAQLIDCLPAISLQRGATWLIKKFLEDKGVLSKEQVIALLSNMNEMHHWEAQLHVLQCLPLLKIPKKVSDQIFSCLKIAIKSDRKFIRAWGYGGLIELGEQHTKYREHCLKLVKTGYHSEGGSIGARIRQAANKRPYWADIFK